MKKICALFSVLCSPFLWLSLTGTLLAANELKAQAPITPLNLTAISETSSRIRLNWQDESSNETYFVVERAQNTDDNFVIVDSVGTDTTEYLDTDLNPETTYFYRIKAINSSGASPYSNTIGASTVPVTSLDVPRLETTLKVYPVPVQDYLNIDLNHPQPLGYTLVALSGKVLQRGQVEKNTYLDLSNLPKGMYFLSIRVNDRRIVKKIMRE